MKRSLTTICIVAFSALLLSAGVQAAEYLDSQQLVTVGSGIVVAPADIAVVSLSIENSAKESGIAHQENMRLTDQIVKALKAENLPGMKFNIRQVMFWENTSLGSKEKSYKASSGLDVQVSDLTAAGRIIDIATKNGATSVQNVRFDLSDIDGAAKKALELAVADALRKANLMASAAGLRVAMVREVRDNNAVRVYNPSQPVPATGADAQLPALASPVYRGQVLVQTEVSIIFDVALDKSKNLINN